MLVFGCHISSSSSQFYLLLSFFFFFLPLCAIFFRMFFCVLLFALHISFLFQPFGGESHKDSVITLFMLPYPYRVVGFTTLYGYNEILRSAFCLKQRRIGEKGQDEKKSTLHRDHVSLREPLSTYYGLSFKS